MSPEEYGECTHQELLQELIRRGTPMQVFNDPIIAKFQYVSLVSRFFALLQTLSALNSLLLFSSCSLFACSLLSAAAD